MRSIKLAKNSPERLARRRVGSSCNALAISTFLVTFILAHMVMHFVAPCIVATGSFQGVLLMFFVCCTLCESCIKHIIMYNNTI